MKSFALRDVAPRQEHSLLVSAWPGRAEEIRAPYRARLDGLYLHRRKRDS